MKRHLFTIHNPVHLKQLGIFVAIAAVGIFSGSLVSANSPKTTSGQPTITNTASAMPSPLNLNKILTYAVPPPSPTPTPRILASKASPAPSPVKASPIPTTNTTQSKKTNFIWGINLQPFPFTHGNEEFLPEQFRLAKDLGVDTVRVDFDPKNDTMNKLVIKYAKESNIKVIFIIPFGPKDIFTDNNLSINAYDYVSDIVLRYKDDIATWSLANEVGATALADGNKMGINTVDYPDAKYVPVKNWLIAAAKAVRDNDPGSKILVTDHWVHTGFFDRFIADGGDFDILGWNWFSEMGRNMDNVLIDPPSGQTYQLLTKLQSFKKDIWLTEVNKRLGSQNNQGYEQADFIQQMAQFAYATPAIKGYFVYKLGEDTTARQEESGYSLIYLDANKHTITGYKPAYTRYKNFISSKRNGVN